MISYAQVQYLKSLINQDIPEEDYNKIKAVLEELNVKRIDNIFKKALEII